ncbi:putative oxidoreductase [Pseudonocardia sulfidoxydans NBRC 16205]|uniref:Putative oxidoreductase n=1 Tax=Pseudonocardia sulfidoxydans NBRC 16205 TaxID=1223511 RepID=A0A511DFT7_9PSEU|nr:nitroreductase family protein [Pseudonocardia sulfidoxydans]GEL23655.1 putative oxidoreductase [Pseudonocardia sulfidoxydans NBRC 16205]
MTDRPAADRIGLIEGLFSTPARRYLSDRPIPEEVLWELLDAATRGPSGGNRQSWGWIVVTDPEVKDRVAAWYREGWEAAYGVRRAELSDPARDQADTGLSPASYRATEHLARHIAEAPVWVVPVLLGAAGSTDPRAGASIYGAVQQLLLAARAHGIGGVLTSFHLTHEREVDDLLDVPDDALTVGIVPLGYPARGRWSAPRRRPVAEVVHWGRWGAARPRP